MAYHKLPMTRKWAAGELSLRQLFLQVSDLPGGTVDARICINTDDCSHSRFHAFRTRSCEEVWVTYTNVALTDFEMVIVYSVMTGPYCVADGLVGTCDFLIPSIRESNRDVKLRWIECGRIVSTTIKRISDTVGAAHRAVRCIQQ